MIGGPNVRRTMTSAAAALVAVQRATLIYTSGLTYRMRVSTWDGTLLRVIRQETAKGGSAMMPRLSKGRYRVELIALNARGQSPPARAAATIR